MVVSVLAHWSSQQVQHANRLILDPGLVETFAFYSPVNLAGVYNAAGAAQPGLGGLVGELAS